jgi:hypothetical protein
LQTTKGGSGASEGSKWKANADIAAETWIAARIRRMLKNRRMVPLSENV